MISKNLKKIIKAGSTGQSMITLLFFIIVGLTITSAAIVVIAVNSLSTDRTQQGVIAYYTAEAGIENALLRLLRNPNYSGETLNINEETTEIAVSGIDTKTIISASKVGNSYHKIQAEASYVDNILTVTSWKEQFE